MRRVSLRPLLCGGLLPLMLTACASSPAADDPGRSVADGANVTLAPGESALLADRSRLRFDRVANDSRCPPDVQCVWAGDAEVAFTWTPQSGSAETFSLHTARGDRSKRLGGREVTLESLGRGATPSAQLRVDAKP